MGSYASAVELQRRYSLTEDYTQAQIDSDFISHAEAEVNARLYGYFTLPFSNNNLTVKDLSLDLAYLKMSKGLDSDKTEKLQERIDKIFEELRSGDRAMMLASTDGVFTAESLEVQQTIGGTVYSNQSQYNEVFGFGDVEDFVVDDDLLDAENSQRLY